MATIPGSGAADTIQGTAQDDVITGAGADDLISGEGLNDYIDGGAGNDTIFGDAGVGTAPGLDASPLTLSSGNLQSDTSTGNNNAQVGDAAVYRDVAMLDDGTEVWGRLVLVSTTNPALNIDLSGPGGAEILLNSGFGRVPAGAEATFRLEFFDPATGDPVALNSVSTFNDLDRNFPGNQESVTIDAGSFTSFATAPDTSLNVTQSGGVVTAAGTEGNAPSDQDAWFSAAFENREFIEFTLEARSTPSGFTLSGDLIDDAVITPDEAGNDTILGGAGNDVILGQGGSDLLIGGAGDDTVDGGEGADSLVAGAGTDQLSGGTASDVFSFTEGGNHVIVGGEDADGSDIDVLDLSGIDTNVIQTGPESGLIEFEDAQGNITHTATYSEIEQVIICFARGTMIATARGHRPVEDLRPRDRIITRDNGIQMLRWVGSRRLTASELVMMPEYQPILIRAGAIAPNMPERDLVVSPNHRVLITSEMATVLFDESEVLVAAKDLTGLDGVDRLEAVEVEYFHLMFDSHQLIISEGAWTESFQPGDYTLKGIGMAQRAEILKLFPELATDAGMDNYVAARRSLKRHEAHLLTMH